MAYIPSSPLPNPPAQSPASLPGWIGPTDTLGFATAGAGAILSTVLGALAARKFGLRGAAFQASVVRNLVTSGLGVVPGVNLFAGLASLIPQNRTLPAYLRSAAIARGQFPIDVGGFSIFVDPKKTPEFDLEASELLAQQGRDLIEAQRVADLRQKESRQRVPFAGVPPIFTRRRGP